MLSSVEIAHDFPAWERSLNRINFPPTPLPSSSPPQLARNRGQQTTRCPSPLQRDVGPSPPRSTEESAEGRRNQGGPKKWEAHAVRCENETRRKSCLILAVLISHTTTDHLQPPSILDTLTSAHRNAGSPTTTQAAQRGRRQSNDNAGSQTTTRVTDCRCTQPNDDAGSQMQA